MNFPTSYYLMIIFSYSYDYLYYYYHSVVYYMHTGVWVRVMLSYVRINIASGHRPKSDRFYFMAGRIPFRSAATSGHN